MPHGRGRPGEASLRGRHQRRNSPESAARQDDIVRTARRARAALRRCRRPPRAPRRPLDQARGDPVAGGRDFRDAGREVADLVRAGTRRRRRPHDLFDAADREVLADGTLRAPSPGRGRRPRAEPPRWRGSRSRSPSPRLPGASPSRRRAPSRRAALRPQAIEPVPQMSASPTREGRARHERDTGVVGHETRSRKPIRRRISRRIAWSSGRSAPAMPIASAPPPWPAPQPRPLRSRGGGPSPPRARRGSCRFAPPPEPAAGHAPGLVGDQGTGLRPSCVDSEDVSHRMHE